MFRPIANAKQTNLTCLYQRSKIASLISGNLTLSNIFFFFYTDGYTRKSLRAEKVKSHGFGF